MPFRRLLAAAVAAPAHAQNGAVRRRRRDEHAARLAALQRLQRDGDLIVSGAGREMNVVAMGSYEDTLVKQDGKWLISKRYLLGR